MKKILTLKTVLIALLCVYVPNLAHAWGVLGHRIVGQIADSYLTANARKGVQKILGNESIAMAANWGDFIRSDANYKDLTVCHYVNLPQGLSKADVFTFLDKDPAPNVYNKTVELIAVLKSQKSTDADKKVALKLLVHFMGDICQPMHVGRQDDYGGNKIQLTWMGQHTNLHAVWDEKLIDFQQLSYTEYTNAINFASVAEQANIEKASLKEMIFESYDICNKIYATGVKTNDKLSYSYNFDWIATVNSQLLKGGIRLAKVLNDIYK